jgi:hypothetical protein
MSTDARFSSDTGPESSGFQMFEQLEPTSSGRLTSSQAASRANRSALLDAIAERLTNATSGRRPSESFAQYDPDSHCWKTFQASLLTATLAEYSETWPKQGTMRSGSVSEPPTSVLPTGGNDSSLWRTPASQESGVDPANLEGEIGSRMYDKKTGRLAQYGLPQQVAMMWPTPDAQVRTGFNKSYGPNAAQRPLLATASAMWPTPQRDWRPGGHESELRRHTPDLNSQASHHGHQAPATLMPGHECSPKCRRLNPLFVEWLQNFPIGWTDLPPSETP